MVYVTVIPLLQLFREVRIMKYLDHPNIGEYLGREGGREGVAS